MNLNRTTTEEKRIKEKVTNFFRKLIYHVKIGNIPIFNAKNIAIKRGDSIILSVLNAILKNRNTEAILWLKVYSKKFLDSTRKYLSNNRQKDSIISQFCTRSRFIINEATRRPRITSTLSSYLELKSNALICQLKNSISRIPQIRILYKL